MQGASTHSATAGYVKNLDFFPKVNRDAIVRSGSGGSLSLIVFVICFILFFGELFIYFTPITEDHMIVDTTLMETIPIDLDITFPGLPCGAAGMDVVDKVGDQQINVHHSIIKYPLTMDGKMMGLELKLMDLGSDGNVCGSCLGYTTSGCCNTCEDVKAMLKREGHWYGNTNSKLEQFPQCLPIVNSPGSGCRLQGVLHVSKVPGNIHVAIGADASPSAHGTHAHHVHRFTYTELMRFNSSHRIDRFWVGDHHLRSSSSRFLRHKNAAETLDGTNRVLDRGLGRFIYYLKFVPVKHERLSGANNIYYEYSATELYTPVNVGQGSFPQPGVFFIYEPSPVMIWRRERQVAFSEFLVSTCAVLGGVFVVIGLVDKLVFHVTELLTGKYTKHFIPRRFVV